jgi:Domain of unknown function (DUF4388)
MSTLNFRQLPVIIKEANQYEKTGSLVIEHKNLLAVLIFQKGRLDHAQIGLPDVEAEGAEALGKVLDWRYGQIYWEDYTLESESNISSQQEQRFYEALNVLMQLGTFETAEAVAPKTPPPQPIAAPNTKPPSPEPTLAPGINTPPPQSVAAPVANTPPSEAKSEIVPLTPRPKPGIATAPLPSKAVTPSALNPTQPPVSDGQSPIIATLTKMGVAYLTPTKQFSLNSHFANALIAAREITGDNWHTIVEAAKLPQYLEENPPDDENHTTPIEYLSRLNYAFERVYRKNAPEKLTEWGRHATKRSLTLRKGSGREQGILRLVPGQQRKLGILLTSFTKSMDNVRGEHLHLWKQVEPKQYWLVHYNNLYAIGRKRPKNACQVWTASFGAMLQWAGLEKDWTVEEIECGCVTGTFNCVFAVRAT